MSDKDRPPKDEAARAAAAESAAGHPKAEEVVTLFKRGLRFTEELLEENERLRFRIATLEAQAPGHERQKEAAGSEALIEALTRQVRELEAERTRLLESFKQVEERNLDYQSRYAEIEEEHNNLANLYIAAYQLHATVGFSEIVRVVAEIVINLVGVQRFTLFLLDGKSDTLHPIFAEGHNASDVAPVKVGEGPIGTAVRDNAPVIRETEAGDGPRAIVPLATLEAKVGAIVIDELLVQKHAFTQVDHELFTLLGAHGATAIIGGLLRERVGAEGQASVLDISQAKKLLEA